MPEKSGAVHEPEIHLVMPLTDAMRVRAALAYTQGRLRDHAPDDARCYSAVWGYVALEIAKTTHPSAPPGDVEELVFVRELRPT